MRKICLLLLLLSGYLPASASRDTLVWSELPLKSEDFKMITASNEFSTSLKLDEHTTLEGYIYSGIHFSCRESGKELYCEVKAYMVPAESWLRDPEDDATLEHEQAHFDITEIYARRLRRDLSKVKTTQEAKKLMQANFNALQAEQKRFDKNHKNENGVHPLWAEKIRTELAALSEWAAPTVIAERSSGR